MALGTFQTAKVTFGVTEGHRYCYDELPASTALHIRNKESPLEL